MKTLIFGLLGLVVNITASHGQVLFEKGSWQQALEKAKSEHKLIYLDVYATSCVPCRVMESTLFPDKSIGDKYNASFVNYKIDADQAEGLAMAKTYYVDAYPTNLFIDPATAEVVYRATGAPEPEVFKSHADIALHEYRDTLNWPGYQRMLKAGKTSREFLIAYLKKAAYMAFFADDALNAYVDHYVDPTPDDSTLTLLLKYTKTLDNKAVDILYSNSERVNAFYPGVDHYLQNWLSYLPHQTLEKAIQLQDEALLKTIEAGVDKYKIKSVAATGVHNNAFEYYDKTGNFDKAWREAAKEADYLNGFTQSDYDKLNESEWSNAEASIRWQLKRRNVPEEQFEPSVKATLEKYPHLKYNGSSLVARRLNEFALYAIEHRKDDSASLAKALHWSATSIELPGNPDLWPTFADTYANLLYLTGNKEKAIALEEEAIRRLEVNNNPDADNLKATLSKMKSGTLK